MGGSKLQQALGTQFAYLTPTLTGCCDYQYYTTLNLTGTPQSNIATFRYYGAAGDNAANAVTMGTSGLSIISASGDTAKIDMSGWKVDWNGVFNIPMGTGAWSTGYTSGVGNLTCTAGSGCAMYSDYTLKYTATVPVGDPSGFGGVKYYLELHGCMVDLEGGCPVSATPEASTYGMMLAGLGLVGIMARRRKQTEDRAKQV